MTSRIDEKGLTIVFTGNGKGKTSAALGVAFRAAGHNLYVSLIQFIKNSTATGEARAAERLKRELEIVPLGKGFVKARESNIPFAEHQEAAAGALDAARHRIHSGGWDIVILDEINTAVVLGLIDLKDVLELVKNKPAKLHLILTGRDAHPDLVAIADLVTEMRALKHPYDQGFSARKGIDF